MGLVAQPQRDDEPDREPVLELRSAEGAAQPGDTVALTVMRTARVKVSTADGSVVIGHCLTAVNLAGHGRAWRTAPSTVSSASPLSMRGSHS